MSKPRKPAGIFVKFWHKKSKQLGEVANVNDIIKKQYKTMRQINRKQLYDKFGMDMQK